MTDLSIVIAASLVGGVLSLVGGIILAANENRTKKLLKYIIPFAAGALLAAAFMDILVEASHTGEIEVALQWALYGIILFLILEAAIKWFHRHYVAKGQDRDSTIPLIIIGDTMHNFIDGIAIAAAFLIDVPTGIVATLAVAAHEIPQEVGDFGLLLQKGMRRANVIKANIASALATTVSATIFFLLGKETELPMGIILGVVAGFFIYIAMSDIVPAIRKNTNQKLAAVQVAILAAGVLLVGGVSTTLHQYIESDRHEVHSHEDHDEH